MKSLSAMPKDVATRIIERMEIIAANPFGQHAAAKRLKGTDDGFRLRVGDWRALYRVLGKEALVLLEDVLKRGEAYR